MKIVYIEKYMGDEDKSFPCKYSLTTQNAGEWPYGQPGQLPIGNVLLPY